MATTIYTWPAALDSAELRVDGFRQAEQDDVVRFTPDVGEPIDRVRHTAVPVVLSVTLRGTKSQATTLYDFYTDTVKRVGRFTMTDPLLETDQTFKFLEPPELTTVADDVWDAKLELMRLP